MKKAGTYIPSVILSVLLVLCVLAGSALIVVDVNVTPSRTSAFSEKEDLAEKVHKDLDKHYRGKANSTGIPASVYMEHLNKEYINKVIDAYIDATYDALNSGGKLTVKVPENTALENSIDSFFSDYADKTGYKKDENYEKKLAVTKENAYKTIGSSCDNADTGISAQKKDIRTALLVRYIRAYCRNNGNYPLSISYSYEVLQRFLDKAAAGICSVYEITLRSD